MTEGTDRYCFVCGEENPIGLHLNFEFDGETLTAKKILPREYEGYEGIVHGGIISAMLDEAMCKFIQKKFGAQAMTGRLEIRYRHPTPINLELTISARQESRRQNIITMNSTCATADGKVTAEATAKFAVVSP